MDDETTITEGLHNRKFVNQRRRTTKTEKEERRKRGRRRKGRRRHDDSYDDEEDEGWYGSREREQVLPKWKLCLVGASIFLCFALLYPSVFSPMLSNLLGGGSHRQQPTASDRPMHPSMMGPNQQQQRERPNRPPPHHPGASMRMPDMHHQQQQQGGFWAGKGGLAWMLPFYTVGVVCFLLYTLFKSKTKRQKRRRDRSIGLLYDNDDNDESTDCEDGMEFGVRGAKLRSVQNRLRKTEQAMADILSQLEQISTHSQQFADHPKAAQPNEQNANDPNANIFIGQNGGENGEQLRNNGATTEGAANAQSVLNDEQTAKVEQSLRELKMLSELCKSDRRLRRKLRAAAQRRKNHSSSASSANSDCNFTDEEEGEGSEEEEEHNGGRESGKEWTEEANAYDDDREEEEEEGGGGGGSEEEEQTKSEKAH